MNPSRYRRDVPEVCINKEDFLRFHAGQQVEIKIPAENFLKMGDLIACRLGAIESACEVVGIKISTDVTKDLVTVKKVRLDD